MARNAKRDIKSNNYQDAAADREYDKGYNAGKNATGKRNDKYRKGRNNYKKGSRSNQYGNKETVAIMTGSSDNDYSWYVPYNQSIKDVASIPSFIRSGYPIKTGQYVTSYIPGVMSYIMLPTFGVAASDSDALNTAATGFFITLRRETSGTSYYEKEDSMLYLISVGNLYSFYSWAVRAYGLINAYTMDNIYTPEALIHSMGISYSSLRRGISVFRDWLNNFAYRLQALPLPNILTYTTRQIFLYESVYTDADSLKSQYSLYNPLGFYKYSEGVTQGDPKGRLDFSPLPCYTNSGVQSNIKPNNYMLIEQIMDYGESLLSPIEGSQDLSQYIASDISKAYGTNVYMVSPIAETFSIRPVYNKEVLSQMENAYIFGAVDVSAELTQHIEVNDSRLVPNITLFASPTDGSKQLSANFTTDSILLNSHDNDLKPEQVLVMTRLSNVSSGFSSISSTAGSLYDNAKYNVMHKIDTCGSEIVVAANIFYYASNTNIANKSLNSFPVATDNYYFASSGSIPSQAIFDTAARLDLLSTFDWHPLVRTIIVNYASSSITSVMASQGSIDYDNYAQIELNTLATMNKSALLGEFASRINVFAQR